MKRSLALVVAVAVVAAMGFVAFMNPATVEFVVPAKEPLKLPLGWLLVLTFAFGALATGALVVVVQAARSLSRLSERWQERQSERAADWTRSGTMLLWDGDLERGRSLLSKAWRRQSRNGALARLLAESYRDSQELDAARRVLQEAVTHDASDPELRRALGETLQRAGELTEAIRILETVRVQHPRALRVLGPLRRLYEKTGRWDEAARVQETYLAVLPGGRMNEAEKDRLGHYRYRAAMAIADPGQRAAALSALMDSHRNCLPAVVSLGDALVEAGRSAEAIRLWERALRERPATVLFERLIAQQPGARDRLHVLGLLRKLRNPSHPDHVHALIARTALQSANVELAATELESISQQDTPSIHRLWAEMHRQRGEVDRALRSLSRAADDGRPVSGYTCAVCGRRRQEWTGTCDQCGNWNTYRSVFELGPA